MSRFLKSCVLTVLCFGSAAGCRSRTFLGSSRTSDAGFVGDAEKLVQLFETSYGPISDWKAEMGVLKSTDVAAAREVFLRDASVVANEDAFFDAAATYVSSFRDGHLAIVRPHRGQWELPFAVDGRGRVATVFDSSLDSGLRDKEVVSVDGKPFEAFVAERIAVMRFGRSEQSRRVAAQLNFVDSRFQAPPVGDVSLVLRGSGEERIEKRFSFRHTPPPAAEDAPPAAPFRFSSCSEFEPRTLKGRVGYDFIDGNFFLSLSTFDAYPDQRAYWETLCGVELVVAEMHQFGAERSRLFLNLMSNTGGNPDLGYDILARLTGKPFHGVPVQVSRSPQVLAAIRNYEKKGRTLPRFLAKMKGQLEGLAASSAPWSPRFDWAEGASISPVGPGLGSIPAVILVGPQCMSVCEIFASIANDQRLIPVVGQPTMGAGNPTLLLPMEELAADGTAKQSPLFASGMQISLSFGRVFRTDGPGTPIENHPLVPRRSIADDSTIYSAVFEILSEMDRSRDWFF